MTTTFITIVMTHIVVIVVRHFTQVNTIQKTTCCAQQKFSYLLTNERYNVLMPSLKRILSYNPIEIFKLATLVDKIYYSLLHVSVQT